MVDYLAAGIEISIAMLLAAGIVVGSAVGIAGPSQSVQPSRLLGWLGRLKANENRASEHRRSL
jgi:hypothetical protein